MDVALNSLLIFFLFVFPGIIFRRFYYVGEFSKQYNSNNWANTFYISLIPGFFIQFISCFLFLNYVYKNPIKFEFIFVNSIYHKLKSDDLPSELFDINLLKWIIIYLSITIIISFVLAQVCWKTVRFLDLDKKFSALRFDNYWHYYLSGESLKFKEFRSILPDCNVILTEADVLVDIGNEGTKLYKGFIRQHTICKTTGDLKAIYLTNVRRYRKDLPPNDIKIVPGHIMLIPAQKIININMTYITVARNTVSYYNLFLVVFNLNAILFILFYPFNFILNNTTLFGLIMGKFWLVMGFFTLSAYIHTYFGVTNKSQTEINSSRNGLFFLFLLIFLILLFFFYL